MMNPFYANALSESLITFLLYILVMVAGLSMYKLVPARIKNFILGVLSTDEQASTTRN